MRAGWQQILHRGRVAEDTVPSRVERGVGPLRGGTGAERVTGSFLWCQKHCSRHCCQLQVVRGAELEGRPFPAKMLKLYPAAHRRWRRKFRQFCNFFFHFFLSMVDRSLSILYTATPQPSHPVITGDPRLFWRSSPQKLASEQIL